MHESGEGGQRPRPGGSLAESWARGVDEFNSRRYWEAHSLWEIGWTRLAGPQRENVQALIQAAGAFHLLLERRREGAARALSRSALLRRAGLRESGALEAVFPRIEIPGLDAALETILREKSPFDPGVVDAIRALRARLEYGLDPKTVR